MYIYRWEYLDCKFPVKLRKVLFPSFLPFSTPLNPPSSMENTKNEALALLWAYELNRENKQLFKGLKKLNRCLDASRPTTSPSCVNNSRQNNGKVNQQPSTQKGTE
jgi:hypothetical protein